MGVGAGSSRGDPSAHSPTWRSTHPCAYALRPTNRRSTTVRRLPLCPTVSWTIPLRPRPYVLWHKACVHGSPFHRLTTHFRYRSKGEMDFWLQNLSPMRRFGKFCELNGYWTQGDSERVRQETRSEVWHSAALGQCFVWLCAAVMPDSTATLNPCGPALSGLSGLWPLQTQRSPPWRPPLFPSGTA